MRIVAEIGTPSDAVSENLYVRGHGFRRRSLHVGGGRGRCGCNCGFFFRLKNCYFAQTFELRSMHPNPHEAGTALPFGVWTVFENDLRVDLFLVLEQDEPILRGEYERAFKKPLRRLRNRCWAPFTFRHILNVLLSVGKRKIRRRNPKIPTC